MKIVSNAEPGAVADALFSRIKLILERGDPVLFLASGGSSAPLAAAALASLAEAFDQKEIRPSAQVRPPLTVSLVDERFGAEGHADSNWRLLVEKGYDPGKFESLPLLRGETATSTDFAEATGRLRALLSDAVERRRAGRLYVVALFGMGTDGHTAGILPGSVVSRLDPEGTEYATGYMASGFARITMAPAFFPHVDFAAVWVNDRTKDMALAELKRSVSAERQPAQLLKLPKETILYTGPEHARKRSDA
jgi:6-phosphogluconolactonase/glucosamine-6-phosphate isomerase/deaminase